MFKPRPHGRNRQNAIPEPEQTALKSWDFKSGRNRNLWMRLRCMMMYGIKYPVCHIILKTRTPNKIKIRLDDARATPFIFLTSHFIDCPSVSGRARCWESRKRSETRRKPTRARTSGSGSMSWRLALMFSSSYDRGSAAPKKKTPSS